MRHFASWWERLPTAAIARKVRTTAAVVAVAALVLGTTSVLKAQHPPTVYRIVAQYWD